ncbi:MAG: OmpA family protein [Acidocella sp.]|nr:OmpA family protein [Acidocella sp.]
MKKILILSVLAGLGGCASVPASETVGSVTPVFFQPFSAALDGPAQNTIAALAKAANAAPDKSVIVTGAADGVGGAKLNEDISATRAQMVADTLVQDGVAPERIVIRSVGSTPALAPVPEGTPVQSARRVLVQLGG